MPPLRTPAARAGKSERTHEENVERAFIAASRRCDRTLEARVESARRASEIHKARTGRGLKITEKDVQNEEMYEEEDDDLPLQYRHLTAGFQTSSPEFNRRFAAYLTTHVAIRTALEQSIKQSYQQQEQQQQQQQQQSSSSTGPQSQFLKHQYEMFPSPFLAHHPQQSQRLTSPAQGSPISRYSPYPTMPRSNISSPLSQVPTSLSNLVPQINEEIMNSDLANGAPQSISLSSSYLPHAEKPSFSPSAPDTFIANTLPQSFNPQQGESSQDQFNFQKPSEISTYGPLSTALTAESQAFLGPNFGLISPSDETCNVTDPLSFTDQSKANTLPTESVQQRVKNNACGLDMTLLPEASVQESPFIFTGSNYFDGAHRDDNLDLTPGSRMNDENDWQCFVDRTDSWLFSE